MRGGNDSAQGHPSSGAMSVKEWENLGSVPWGVSVLPLAAGSVWGVKASLPACFLGDRRAISAAASVMPPCRQSQASSAPQLGGIHASKSLRRTKRASDLLQVEYVGRGERRWGYFRAGCRKSKVKAKSSPEDFTFKSLGVRYTEFAGDWKRKEHAKLCNSIGCSCSNYWPGSNLLPTCSYRSQWLVLVKSETHHSVHCLNFPVENLIEKLENNILLQNIYIYIILYIYIYNLIYTYIYMRVAKTYF